MTRGRNIYHGDSGMRGMPMMIVFAFILLTIGGIYVIMRQRLAESRQHIESMRHEMTRIETALVSLQAQQGAMLTPESLNQRLQSKGTALVKIPARSHVVVEPRQKDQGVAMENRPAEEVR